VYATFSTGAFLLGVYVPLILVLLLVAARSFETAKDGHGLSQWARSHIWRVLVWSGGAIAAVAIGASATRMLDPNDSHEVIRQRATWGGASKAFALLAVGGLGLLCVVGFGVVLLHQVRRWAADSAVVERVAGIVAMVGAGAGWALVISFVGGMVWRVSRTGSGSFAWWFAYLVPIVLTVWLGDWSSLKRDILNPYRAALASRRRTTFWRNAKLNTPLWGRASLDDIASAITDVHDRVARVEERQLEERFTQAVAEKSAAEPIRTVGWAEWWASRPRVGR
jgi:hypothetical protein